jgi:hypothetical protein
VIAETTIQSVACCASKVRLSFSRDSPGARIVSKIASQASGQESLTVRSAQRRSNAVKRCGNVMATIAQAASSSYHPPAARSIGWTLRFRSAESSNPPCPAVEWPTIPSA